MSKIRKKIKPSPNSTMYNVCRTLLKNPDVTATSLPKLSDILFEKFGLEISRRRLGEIINGYNDGLIYLDDLTCDEIGRILNLTNKKKKNKKNEKLSTLDIIEDVGLIKTFKEHCVDEGIDPSEAQGGWIKTKNLSVRVKTDIADTEKDMDRLLEAAKEKLSGDFWKVVDNKVSNVTAIDGRSGVLHIADLHIGAFVRDLIKTKDYDVSVIKQKLINASNIINEFDYDKVYIMIYGDLIESFTGLNHPNSWKELEQGIFGVEAIKVVVNILTEFFLNRINNVSDIFMVGGNHDRMTSNSHEDTKGSVSNIVAFCLELCGYSVQFNPLVISTVIDDINYIMLHGDKGISKRPTKEIIWDYGTQGIFNFVMEGHLHSRIQKLTAKGVDGFKLTTDDSVDCRRMVLPSLFTGNSYSDDNNWFSNSGMIVTQDCGIGIPLVMDIPL